MDLWTFCDNAHLLMQVIKKNLSKGYSFLGDAHLLCTIELYFGLVARGIYIYIYKERYMFCVEMLKNVVFAIYCNVPSLWCPRQKNVCLLPQGENHNL